MVTNRRRSAAPRARRPIATAARRSGSGQDRPDGQNDHDDPDRDAGATTTDGTQRDEYDNDSPKQAGGSSPLTMFGPPFWAISRTRAEKPAALPERPRSVILAVLDLGRAEERSQADGSDH